MLAYMRQPERQIAHLGARGRVNKHEKRRVDTHILVKSAYAVRLQGGRAHQFRLQQLSILPRLPRVPATIDGAVRGATTRRRFCWVIPTLIDGGTIRERRRMRLDKLDNAAGDPPTPRPAEIVEPLQVVGP
jgi:hypothetical protein